MSDHLEKSPKRRERDWLDTALAGWPDVPRSEAEQEAMATAIERRIAAGERGTSLASMSDEKIFEGPVGQTPEESHNTAASSAATSSTTSAAPASRGARGKSEESMSMSSDRERDRRSLQELAKLANATPAPSSVRFDVGPLSGPLSSPSAARKDEDSGLVDLKAFAPAPEPAPAPASAPPPASVAPAAPSSTAPAVVAAGPASVSPVSAAPSSASVDAPLSAPAVASVASAASAPATPAIASASKPESNNGKLIAIGGLFAIAAIAAGTFFAFKGKAEAPAPVAVNTPVETKAPVKAPVAEAPAATAAPEEKAPETTPAAAAKAPAVKASTGTAKTEPKEEKKEEKKVTAADLPASGGGSGDLGAAMRQAAGPGAQAAQEDKPTGPQFAAGSVPQKPSQGAVTGALGAVLGGARACLQPDDPVSRATVTFASAGNVSSVSVSGGAAGKPAEACIKAALSKAKVAPFAEATYSAPVTIRH